MVLKTQFSTMKSKIILPRASSNNRTEHNGELTLKSPRENNRETFEQAYQQADYRVEDKTMNI